MVNNALTLIGINFAERLMYIPSAFLCVLAAIGLVRLPRRIAIVALTVVLVIFSLRTVTYAWRWNDRLRLYEMTLAEMPRNVRLYMVLAEELARRGDYDRASSVIAEGRDLAGIRRAAVRAYAKGQGKTPRRVSGGFTNPADKRTEDYVTGKVG